MTPRTTKTIPTTTTTSKEAIHLPPPPKKKPAARKQAAKKTSDNGQEPLVEEPEETTEEKAPVSEYQPRHLELANAGMDQHAAEEERQAELQTERDEHNERTGDASR
jgi:hypothetical protein